MRKSIVVRGRSRQQSMASIVVAASAAANSGFISSAVDALSVSSVGTRTSNGTSEPSPTNRRRLTIVSAAAASSAAASSVITGSRAASRTSIIAAPHITVGRSNSIWRSDDIASDAGRTRGKSRGRAPSVWAAHAADLLNSGGDDDDDNTIAAAVSSAASFNADDFTFDDDNDDDDDDNDDDDDDDDEGDGDYTRGAELLAGLENQALELERTADDLEEQYRNSMPRARDGGGEGEAEDMISDTEPLGDASILEERDVIVRRALRFRCYMGAMLAAGLEGPHPLEDTEVHKVLNVDKRASQNIQAEDGAAVASAIHRMEFLLDRAEARMRDAVLCAWSKKVSPGQLEKALEVYINGYYIELVGLLARFFRDGFESMHSGAMQGLGSKMHLLKAYMEHDDRLATIVDSVVQCSAFPLVVSPRPLLHPLLPLDTLLAWHSSALNQEMRTCVDAVLAIWEDPEKNAGGLVDKYRHARLLPWVPMRTRGDEGKFQSLVPEDVVAYLQQYVTLSRLGEDNVSDSFRSQVHKLEAHIHLSFGAAFKFLSDRYARAVNKGPKVPEAVARATAARGVAIDWTRTQRVRKSAAPTSGAADPAPATELDPDTVHALDDDEREQLDEHIEWLCSVANDCRRITENALIEKAIAPKLMQQKNLEAQNRSSPIDWVSELTLSWS